MAIPFSFQRSRGQAFVRSFAQARNANITTTLSSTVCCVCPLFGFGTFNGSTSFSGAFPASSRIGSITFNSVWPMVYTTITETLSDSGGTKTIVSTYTPYVDQIPQPLVVTTGSASGGPFTITTTVVSPTLITATYAGGSYSAQLSGSILNPTGVGPFNPLDGTYGWAALTALVNSNLNQYGIPYFGITSSPPPVYTSISQARATVSTGASGLYQPNGYTAAAMNGMPFYAAAGGNSNLLEIFPVIIDDNGQVDFGSAIPNQGFCISLKSLWNIASGDATHNVLYVQQWDPTSFTSSGTIAAATNYSNPLSLPAAQTFIPSDVAANASTTYGILGFKSVGA